MTLEPGVSRLPGLGWRLPSEAEWEYACRAGTVTSTWAGELEIADDEARVLDGIAWYGGNQGSRDQRTRAVGQKYANPRCLFDMLGNVYEWCTDWYGPYPEGEMKDPEGLTQGLRVIRGGSWLSGARLVRAACRLHGGPSGRYGYLGFRLALGPGRGAP